MKCAVNNCKNRNHSKACALSFFSFPSDPALLKQWIHFCDRREKFNAKTSHICMEHFKTGDFENNLQFEMGFTKKRYLKHGAVPTIRKESHTNEDLSEERSLRIEKRENRKIVERLLKEQDAESVSVNDAHDETEVFIEHHPEYEEFVECQNTGMSFTIRILNEDPKNSNTSRKRKYNKIKN